MPNKTEYLRLLALVFSHALSYEKWIDGPPIALFRADGYWCIQYASGNWWHYSLKDKSWF